MVSATGIFIEIMFGVKVRTVGGEGLIIDPHGDGVTRVEAKFFVAEKKTGEVHKLGVTSESSNRAFEMLVEGLVSACVVVRNALPHRKTSWKSQQKDISDLDRR